MAEAARWAVRRGSGRDDCFGGGSVEDRRGLCESNGKEARSLLSGDATRSAGGECDGRDGERGERGLELMRVGESTLGRGLRKFRPWEGGEEVD